MDQSFMQLIVIIDLSLQRGKAKGKGNPINSSGPKAPSKARMVVVVVMVSSGCGCCSVPVDDALDVTEVVDAAGYGDGPLLVEPVLLLRQGQQPHKERVIQIFHWYLEPLLLLALLPHPYPHPPFRRHHRLLSRPFLVAQVRHVEVEA